MDLIKIASRFKFALWSYVGIALLFAMISLFIKSSSISKVIAFVSVNLSSRKLFFIVILFSLLIRVLFRQKYWTLKVFGVLLTLCFTAVYSIYLINEGNETLNLNTEILDSFWSLCLVLLGFAFIANCIALSHKLTKYFAYALWIFTILFICLRFIFFEEYFFSKIRDSELNIAISPILTRYLLLIAFLLWFFLSMAMVHIKDFSNQKVIKKPYEKLLVLLIATAFLIVLYYKLNNDVLQKGMCESLGLDCLKLLWTIK